MKKKICIFTILILMAGCVLSGCNGNSDMEDNDQQSEDQTQLQDENEEQDGETEKSIDDQAESQEDVKEGLQNYVCVYYSNADATAFETADVEIDSLAPRNVLEALVSRGTLTADIHMLSFLIDTVDDKESIELDLNKAFATYLSNMDTAAEYYVVGALCNTFLEAYDCDQIKITVEGDDLSTSHAEYPGYLSRFE